MLNEFPPVAGSDINKKTLHFLPKAGLSLAAAPKLKPPICGAALLETGVPNWGTAAPKANPLGADWAAPEGVC